ncbi:hypothetical protein B0H34DRAFT_674573 [Crassisporium funariophilum]|nr:hypothetical protein B0H34DRAFT_674573 [Crassisporium funariophilum]
MTLEVASMIAPEIIWFQPSEEFLEGPTRLLDGVSKDSVSNGMIGSYHGFEMDHSGLVVWVIAWETLARHQNFMEHEAYVDSVSHVMEAMVGQGEITQVLLDDVSAFTKAVSSPVTQFIYITVRPLHDRSYELVPMIERLKKELRVVPGCQASCWGPCVEQDTIQLGIVGWKSRQDRDRAVRGPLSSIIKLITEVGKVELRYAKLLVHN